MGDKRVVRRLTAILAADVAGYSRLMGADEEGTLAALKALRSELIDPKVAEYQGRIVKTTGDGALVEFASVFDAVRCGSIFSVPPLPAIPASPKTAGLSSASASISGTSSSMRLIFMATASTWRHGLRASPSATASVYRAKFWIRSMEKSISPTAN